MKIAIASDHAGFELKNKLKEYIEKKGNLVKDFGSYTNEAVDYPDYGHPLAEAVEKKEYDLGISICGTGNGINMTVNKHQKIRSALCWNVEIAELARKHNNANICALPARFISEEMAISIVDTFLSTSFDGGRHAIRINKIPNNSV
ncbi:MAG: ribose 5-phosphate isomerase B [Bacteroidales bacterium]|nr:ribose 5-phosphate isomerase B [Bacteroidales bacterium]